MGLPTKLELAKRHNREWHSRNIKVGEEPGVPSDCKCRDLADGSKDPAKCVKHKVKEPAVTPVVVPVITPSVPVAPKDTKND